MRITVLCEDRKILGDLSRRSIDLRHRAPGKAFAPISLRGIGAVSSENSGRPLPSATGATSRANWQSLGDKTAGEADQIGSFRQLALIFFRVP